MLQLALDLNSVYRANKSYKNLIKKSFRRTFKIGVLLGAYNFITAPLIYPIWYIFRYKILRKLLSGMISSYVGSFGDMDLGSYKRLYNLLSSKQGLEYICNLMCYRLQYPDNGHVSWYISKSSPKPISVYDFHISGTTDISQNLVTDPGSQKKIFIRDLDAIVGSHDDIVFYLRASSRFNRFFWSYGELKNIISVGEVPDWFTASFKRPKTDFGYRYRFSALRNNRPNSWLYIDGHNTYAMTAQDVQDGVTVLLKKSYTDNKISSNGISDRPDQKLMTLCLHGTSSYFYYQNRTTRKKNNRMVVWGYTGSQDPSIDSHTQYKPLLICCRPVENRVDDKK